MLKKVLYILLLNLCCIIGSIGMIIGNIMIILYNLKGDPSAPLVGVIILTVIVCINLVLIGSMIIDSIKCNPLGMYC